jgi:pectinesterase
MDRTLVGPAPPVRRGLLRMVVCVALAGATAVPHAQSPRDRHRLRIVLVGDSTVSDETGWGLGFRRWLTDDSECVNAAANGRSSKSYIDEGRWANALALHGDYYLIQFGHNDEPGKGADRESDADTSYTANLARYVADVRGIGATPILVTSLTRRAFDRGHIVANLEPYVAAMKRVAAATGTPIIDLHAASVTLAETLGEAAWPALSPRNADGAVDRTHLNGKGSVAVARLVAEALRVHVPGLALALRPSAAPMAVVAADGTGDYTTVQSAIDAVPQSTSATNRWFIFVQPGIYRERVYIQHEKRFVLLVGADPSRVLVSDDLSASMPGPDGQPIGTFRTPTVQVDADDFTAENITFENAAGRVGQALAVRVDGDRVMFRNCRFLGWQDTLLLNRGRHYIEDSLIAGDVDFIFGGAAAWFEGCRLLCRRDGYITAASTPAEAPHGFVFANGSITGESDVRAYLGRPWRDFAQVTFLNTDMSAVVRGAGWHNWDRPEREKTTRYREYASRGPGGDVAARVPWARQLSNRDAAALSPKVVLGGSDNWNPLADPAHPSVARALDSPPRTPAR